MAHDLADGADVHPGGQQQRRAAVPKIMQPDLADSGLRAQLDEAPGDRVRPQRVAVVSREHQVMIGVYAVPFGAVLVLPEPMFEQQPGRVRVQYDLARLAGCGLGRAEVETGMPGLAPVARVAPGKLGELTAHHEHALLKVHVCPCEPETFAPA